jgi:hypothetical protein
LRVGVFIVRIGPDDPVSVSGLQRAAGPRKWEREETDQKERNTAHSEIVADRRG